MAGNKRPQCVTGGGSVHYRINESAFVHPKLRAVRVHVHEHISDATMLTLERTAAVARLAPKSFSDLFKRQVGVPFSTWRDWTRIQRAKRIFVASPWKQVEVVGTEVGYTDCTTFSRSFKRYEGVTPSQFRDIARSATGELPATAPSVPGRLIHSAKCLAHASPATLPLLIGLADMMRRLQR